MTLRLFLRCCMHSKSKEERKTELDVRRVIYENKDNSFDKTDKDSPPVNINLLHKDYQQSEQMKATGQQAIDTLHNPASKKLDNEQEEVKASVDSINHKAQEIVNASKPESISHFANADKSGKRLLLKVLESFALPKDTIIPIFPTGYKESKRKIRDGSVYFGVALEGNLQGENFVNDFVMPSEENGFGKRHFAILYDTSILLTRH